MIGYKAAGKSTIAKYFADSLGYKYIDTDSVILSKIAPNNGYTNISDNFDLYFNDFIGFLAKFSVLEK